MYFITCFEKIDIGQGGWLDVGDSRTFGYEKTLQAAIEDLNMNMCDMHECICMYAVIENISSGIHSIAEERYFFKYDQEKQGFFEIEEPKEFDHYCNIAIG